MWPERTSWSLWQTPQAWTFSRISPTPGSSMGTSLISRGWFAPVSTAALKVFGRVVEVLMLKSSKESSVVC
jgi:hypothetical protein